MKIIKMFLLTGALLSGCNNSGDMSMNTPVANDYLYIDIHHLEKGKAAYASAADAHQKDLMTEKKYGVEFIRYWVDEESGTIFCLTKSPGKKQVILAHKEAHGFIPGEIHEVKSGDESEMSGNLKTYLDIHYLGKGKVTEEAVAEAHKKDLMVQDKYQVSFINYWVDVKNGFIYCLSQSPDKESIVKTHTESHGLIPQTVMEVTETK